MQEQHVDNNTVWDVLETSTHRVLDGTDWDVLFQNCDLFPRVNSFSIPPGVEGMYRVDCIGYADNNQWRQTSSRKVLRNADGLVEFNVRNGYGVFEADGWFLRRQVVRMEEDFPRVTFVHYWYEQNQAAAQAAAED
ncbi:unnamed protein product [Arabis nemorensis]|uniref:Uncharacterized protein n=1 Tax=Arabis nemorensis TaxID=586526 RepID=A0A565B1E8_9BRAS|nr:unnamed protein product [Arabis nemorensis]